MVDIVQPGLRVDIYGSPGSDNPVVTQVAASATAVTLSNANNDRRGCIVANDSSAAIMYLKLGASPSATSHTVALNPGDYLEIPFGYHGVITAVWASATGNCRVTEIF